MSILKLVIRSLLFHWRMNCAVAFGAAVATAVLTGALLVGDSMRGSLRALTLERLGRIDEALVADRFFREKLAEELSAALSAALPGQQVEIVPAIILSGSLSQADRAAPRRVNRVNIIGCDERFWALGSGAPRQAIGPGQVVLNQPAAELLDVRQGDQVLLHLPRPTNIPGDSPLGKKTDTTRTVRATVAEVLPAEGLGRFGLRPAQQSPRNAYVQLAWFQRQLLEPQRINCILAAGTGPASRRVRAGDLLKPRLEDYGISVTRTARGYINITSDRLLLEPAAEQQLLGALSGHRVQPALTYLANSIACGDRSVPYSTVTAIDFAADPPLGPLLQPDGKPLAPLGEDQIVLNDWTAQQMQANVGDTIRLSYYEPESSHGQLRETTVELRLAAIASLSGAAADPDLTPTVPGLTDKRSMANWEAPFPLDTSRIQQRDEDYYQQHGLTPKAFVSLATGRRLWASRFGQTTSLRIAPDEITPEELAAAIELDPTSMGFVFQPVKEQGLAAAAGTTPFSVLFVAFSSFIIAAGVLLTALLFRLSLERRARELGLLLAIGWPARKLRRLCIGEGLTIAALGSVLGVAGGIGYAKLMIFGLHTWWLPAIGTPFLDLYIGIDSLLAGFAIGLLVAALAIIVSLGRTARLSARALLAGQLDISPAAGYFPPAAAERHLARSAELTEAPAETRPGSGAARSAASVSTGHTATTERGPPGGVQYTATTEHGPLGGVQYTATTERGPPDGRTTCAQNARKFCHDGRSSVSRRWFVWPTLWLARHHSVPKRGNLWTELALLLVVVGLPGVLWVVPLEERIRAGAFFAAGAIALFVLLVLLWRRLERGATGPAVRAGRGNLLRMALRNAARNPLRSALSAGLLAAAVFLITATSAFRLDQSQQAGLSSGTGGFTLVAESEVPIHYHPGTEEGRQQLGFSPDELRLLAATTVVPLRIKGGDDASCRNLYRPAQPRMLGVPDELIDRGGFAWAARPADCDNPWTLLRQPLPADPEGVPQYPVILEKNTANYSLHLWKGLGESIELSDSRGRTVRLVIVALLDTSIFQGELLLYEDNLLRLYPEVVGQRMFLIQTSANQAAAVAAIWERYLAEYGLAVETAAERLAGFLAVQNTYLSTFQSLGGLGLLLGTLGLAAVQLRNAVQRRGELALLRATGLSRKKLALMVVQENALLLLAGLTMGIVAAFVAVLPQWTTHTAVIPLASLAALLAGVLAAGVVGSLWSARAVLRTPLLPALREEH